MSDIQTLLQTTLKAYAPLTTLCDEIWAVRRPQRSTYPAIVYHVYDNDFLNTLDGVNDGLQQASVQFDVYGRSYSAMLGVATQIRQALAAATLFKSVIKEQHDMPYSDDTEAYRLVVQASLWFNP